MMILKHDFSFVNILIYLFNYYIFCSLIRFRMNADIYFSAGRIRVFHLLEKCAAERTTKKTLEGTR